MESYLLRMTKEIAAVAVFTDENISSPYPTYVYSCSIDMVLTHAANCLVSRGCVLGDTRNTSKQTIGFPAADMVLPR